MVVLSMCHASFANWLRTSSAPGLVSFLAAKVRIGSFGIRDFRER